MNEFTPQDLPQRDALYKWSSGDNCPGLSRLSLGPPKTVPLILLSLEGSNELWFHLGAMCPNRSPWSVTVPEIRRIPYGTGGSLFQTHTRQSCKMSQRIDNQVLQVEGTLVTEQYQYPKIHSLSQVFLDGIFVGEAVMEGFRGWIHRSGPAYVASGGMLLGIHAPERLAAGMYGPPRQPQFQPPIINMWLRTTKVEIEDLPVKEHFHDSHRRVGRNPPGEMWRTGYQIQPDKYLRVRQEIGKTTDSADVWEPYNKLLAEETPLVDLQQDVDQQLQSLWKLYPAMQRLKTNGSHHQEDTL